jgi:hypothetical protein
MLGKRGGGRLRSARPGQPPPRRQASDQEEGRSIWLDNGDRGDRGTRRELIAASTPAQGVSLGHTHVHTRKLNDNEVTQMNTLGHTSKTTTLLPLLLLQLLRAPRSLGASGARTYINTREGRERYIYTKKN